MKVTLLYTLEKKLVSIGGSRHTHNNSKEYKANGKQDQRTEMQEKERQSTSRSGEHNNLYLMTIDTLK